MMHFLFFLWSFWGGLGSQSDNTSTAWMPPCACEALPGDTLRFSNPSFEGTPKESTSPPQWSGSDLSSTPDIFPGAWDLPIAPFDGKTCIGLVTREDGTSEDIGQPVNGTLLATKCYSFSISLRHSEQYVGYNQATRLRVWGGMKKGEKTQLLASSPLVSNTEWNAYRFQFVPAKDVKYITFEAYYAPGVDFKYKGNILLDNCSIITKCKRA